MRDVKAHLEKLRGEAAECRLISDLATDKKKRELFSRLADHLSVLATEIANAVIAQKRTDLIADSEVPRATPIIEESN
jgi:hypothetical protein